LLGALAGADRGQLRATVTHRDIWEAASDRVVSLCPAAPCRISSATSRVTRYSSPRARSSRVLGGCVPLVRPDCAYEPGTNTTGVVVPRRG
jgi:hypothetical protein